MRIRLGGAQVKRHWNRVGDMQDRREPLRLAFQDATAYLLLMNHHAIALALASAALFGFSTPAAKALLGSIEPAMLAGLLYCGAGLGIAVLRRAGKRLMAPLTAEAPLGSGDAPWLGGAILTGGVIAPVLLMIGLSRTDASTASLLLTLEGVATALLAWFVFHENFDRRIALGMACLVGGAIVLSWTGQPKLSGILGPLAIAGACAAWGLDNNLTRKVSLADPLQIVELKGLIAGPVNLAIGLWAGGSLPPLTPLLIAGLVGFLGYGVSLALFVFALRDLGTARTAAYFSTAPFLGTVAAIVVLREPVTAQLLVAGLLMGLGVWLHLTEDHQHEHLHEAMEHTHVHEHDAHHRHAHLPGDAPGEPHAHPHRHKRMRHTHPHVPDMHHTHRH
jgi:drug/metabolite transporter (DMT)-like permease